MKIAYPGRVDGRNRRIKEPTVRQCIVCFSEFKAVRFDAKICSQKCRGIRAYLSKALDYECVACGKRFQSKQYKASCCSPACVIAVCSSAATKQAAAGPHPSKIWPSRADAYRHYGAVRRMSLGANTEIIDSRAIFARDGWVCQLCGEEVDKQLAFPHPRSASLDHKIPLAKGGDHIAGNVQCAHFGCNSRKGAYLAEEVA